MTIYLLPESLFERSTPALRLCVQQGAACILTPVAASFLSVSTLCPGHHTHPSQSPAHTHTHTFCHLVFLLNVTLSSLFSLPETSPLCSHLSSHHRNVAPAEGVSEPHVQPGLHTEYVALSARQRARDDYCGVIKSGSFAINPKESPANPCRGRKGERATGCGSARCKSHRFSQSSWHRSSLTPHQAINSSLWATMGPQLWPIILSATFTCPS